MNLIHHTQSTRNNEQIHYSVSRSKTSQPGAHARTHARAPSSCLFAHTRLRSSCACAHTSASTAWKSPYYHCNTRNHGAFQMFDMNNPSTLNKLSFRLAGAINQPHSGCRESSWEILLTRCDKTCLLFNALSEQWASTKGPAWDSSLGSLGAPASPRGAGRTSWVEREMSFGQGLMAAAFTESVSVHWRLFLFISLIFEICFWKMSHAWALTLSVIQFYSLFLQWDMISHIFFFSSVFVTFFTCNYDFFILFFTALYTVSSHA